MIAVALIPLLKVVAGITAVNLVGEVVYHVLTKEKIKEECEKKFKEQQLFLPIMKYKVMKFRMI